MDPMASSQGLPPSSSQGPPLSSTTENPIAAVGRKVKSVLSTSQRPSVRIVPESISTRKNFVPVQGPESRTEPNASGNASFLNRVGSSVRSLFGSKDNTTEEEPSRDEYDPDTVDLLDVVGMYEPPLLKGSEVTLSRPRSIYALHPHQCPKFTLRPIVG